jgi:hypothetical protein
MGDRGAAMMRFVRAAGLSFVWLVAAGCASAGGIVHRGISPDLRRPLVAARLPLPPGSIATAVWMGPEGSGLVALRDGRLFAVDPRGGIHAVDPLPGEFQARTDTVIAFGDRGGGSPVGLTSRGAVLVDGGVAHHDAVPPFLSDARALAPLANEALWATSGGLFLSRGPEWVSIEASTGPLRDVTNLVPVGDVRRGEAWVLAGPTLRKLRVDGAGAHVTWVDAAPGIELAGGVRAVARVDATRAALATSKDVAIVGPDAIRVFAGEDSDGPPAALGGGGGWAWVGWRGRILRTDGDRWESLASLTLGEGSRIAVDPAAGATALVLDQAGGVARIVAADAMRTSGIADGATTLDPRIELEALPSRSEGLESVSFRVDGNEVAVRKEAPWGWAPDGGRSRDLKLLAFGTHTVDVVGRYRGGGTLTRSLRFDYASPLGRVPTYATDVTPIYIARCARCHSNGVAHDLATYDALSREATRVRASVREGRMPPDILLDRTSVAILTAWVDGDTPR